MKCFSPLLLVLLLLVTRDVAAQAPSAADRESARTLMSDGDRAMREKRYAEALRAYREADAIMRVPTTGAAVATAHEAMGSLVEAKEACRIVIAFPTEASEPAPFASARRDCEALTGALQTRIPNVTVALIGLPRGTTPSMTIDGERVVVASFDVKRRVNPGTHRIVVVAPGYAPVEQSFTVLEGASARVEVVLRATGETTPTAQASLLPSPPATSSVDATDAAPVPLYAKVALGVGAAGIAVGSITGVMAISRVDEAKKLCVGKVCDPAAADDIDASKTWSHVSTLSFALGAIGVGVGVYGILTRQPTKGRAALSPFFSGTGAGVSGSF